MFCEKCGAQLRDGAQFCSSCGAKVDVDESTAPKAQPFNGKLQELQSMTEQFLQEQSIEEQVPEDIFSETVDWYEDAALPKGMFRNSKGDIMWNYSLDMVRNPFILHLFYKIFLSCGFVFGLIIALAFGSSMGAFDEAVGVFFVIFLGFGGGLSLLATLVYFLNMSIGGSIYTVMHIMTNECIHYSLIGSESDEKSKEKARKLMGVVNFLSNGISSSGLAIETNTYMVSEYKEVKKIICDRDRDLIRLKHNVLQNRIYVSPQQYDFVLAYISSRCTEAKIVK